ncbi:T9SS type A sorting domain-containing protein [candidate division KSB1 bacterium]|nr:T9SS type A sorting domain-containing protein [candidate division KSB1 bacterium]
MVKDLQRKVVQLPRNASSSRVVLWLFLSAIILSAMPVFGQASIGGYAWIDENNDGIRDPSERGFSGLLVQLYHKADLNYFSVIGAQRTASNGHFLYVISSDLLPGECYLQFEPAAGLAFSPANQGYDETIDSDIDPATGRTDVVVIENGYNNIDWGAGYTQQQAIPPDTSRQDTTTTPPPPPPPPTQKQADLSLIMYADKSTVQAGDTLYYTIEINNLGPDTAAQVQVLLPWSPALQLLQSDPPPQEIYANPLEWMLPDMAPQDMQQILISAQVVNAASLNESACVSSQAQDSNLSNNCQFFQVDLEVPVELTSFTAMLRNDGVHLNWVTQSEKENMGFYVLRADAEHGPYERRNTSIIPGHGTTAIKHSYAYIDEQIHQDLFYYYKLQDIDYSGRSILHGPITVSTSLPQVYELKQNYPNPFNALTKIEFVLANSGEVRLSIYNTLGQMIRSLLSQPMSAGAHEVTWDGLDEKGQAVPSGVYFYMLQVNDFQQICKMQVIR